MLERMCQFGEQNFIFGVRLIFHDEHIDLIHFLNIRFKKTFVFKYSADQQKKLKWEGVHLTRHQI